jgi:ribosomal protein S9
MVDSDERSKKAEEAKLKSLPEGKVEPSVIALRKMKGGKEAELKMSTKQMPKITIHEYEDGHTQDVSVLIPEDVFAVNTAGDYPIHVRFHGGGFVSQI